MPMNLGIGIGIGFQNGARPTGNPLCDAIAKLVCVTVKFDDQVLKLAPHVVYRRGRKEVPTLDAVLLMRDDRPVNHQSLRTYRVDELSEITVTDDGFTVLAGFEADDPEYAGRTICVVKTVEVTDNGA